MLSGFIYRSQVRALVSAYWSPRHQLLRLVKALEDLRVSVAVDLEWFPYGPEGLEGYFRIPSDREEMEAEWREAWETFNR